MPLRAVPVVVRDAVGPIAAHDLAQDRGQVLAVVRPVDARDVQTRDHVRLAARIVREPVRMSAIKLFVRAVRVHAREYREAILARGARELAEQVAIAELARAAMKRHLRRVVSHDAARVEHDSLHARALPVRAPEIDVDALRVDLGEIGLAPAQRVFEPGTHAVRGAGDIRQRRRGYQARAAGLEDIAARNAQTENPSFVSGSVRTRCPIAA